MRGSLTTEETRKLRDFKLRLINSKTDAERLMLLSEIEQLLNKANQRSKFLSTFDVR